VCSIATLEGVDVSSLYDAQTLQYWRGRYRTSTTKIFEQVIRPALHRAEAERLAGVAIEYPLPHEEQTKDNPLLFYVPPDFSRVVMPVLSLKFLDDLCTAYAWLQVNGYAIDTISEYTAMLMYKNFGGRALPVPLTALQIPRDALSDKRVDELALGHFVTARTFLVLHELGHIYHARLPRTLAESRQNEEAADAFAVEVMARTPLPPLGALVFFLADASWAEYPPKPRTHPLTGSRLRALALRMQDRELAASIRELGELVDSPEARAATVITARGTDVTTLQPRKGHLQLRAPTDRATSQGATPFDGRYSGQATQEIDPGQSFPIEVVFSRNGNTVRGQYSFGLGLGLIDGVVAGNTLQLHWVWGGREGLAIMRISPDGRQISGTWGYNSAHHGGGTWRLRRP
jgi:hypothetical protein